jgi:hypothetical protein
VLIDYERLQGLLCAATYDQLRNSHRGWAEAYCGGLQKNRRDEWTGNIAVGSRAFVEKARALLGFRSRGRKVIETAGGYQLRDEPEFYIPLLGAEKEYMGCENTYFWNVIP